MTPKNFVYLAGAAIASLLLAIVSFTSSNPWSTGPAGGEKLIPGLVDSIRQVTAIEVRQGADAAVLERAENGTWSLKSRDGYPVDIAKIRTLLVGLSQAELIESKTSNPEKYAVLELENPADKSAKSHLVRLLGGDGKPIAEVVVGKKRQEGYGMGKTGGTYVRRPGNPQTWLANADIDAPVAAKDWVKTAVLSLDGGKINRISLEVAGEQPLKIERAAAATHAAAHKDAKADAKSDGKAEAKADAKAESKAPPAAADPGKLAFVGFPADGKKLKDASAAEGVARAVGSIDLEDVRKLAATPSGDGVSVIKIESADGLATTLRLRKEGDAQWLSVAAAGEGDAKKAADDITARTQGWEFKVPAWQAEAMLKKRADLIEASGS